jgi:hypothetical protein
LYCNDGDWVESLSAIVETNSGELKILHWPYRSKVDKKQDQEQDQEEGLTT